MASITQPQDDVVYEMDFGPSWWDRIKESGAWTVSLALHVVVLFCFSLITFSETIREQLMITSEIQDIPQEAEFKFDVAVSDVMGNDSNFNMLGASQQASVAMGQKSEEEFKEQLEDPFKPELPATEAIVEPPRTELTQAINAQGATEHPGGVEGAVDRMAFEIAASLREKKTLVVWLFDVSPSLHKRRNVIADRVENIYAQLNAMNVSADKALKSAVVTFGERTNILTEEPVDDVAQLVKTVRGVKSESGGHENTFGAVITAANKFLSYRTKMGRNVMLIVVTDEAGSDAREKLEQAISSTKRAGIRCYVVGDAAPFGKRQVEEPFELENGEQVIGVMDRGPESFYQEFVHLGFWGINDYGLENLSSGFGPYALTRLCAETGGLYFVADSGKGPSLDPQTMRNYQPDYRTITLLDQDIRKNMAKQALVTLAEQNKDIQIPLPSLGFPAANDGELRTSIDRAQRPLADFDYKISQLLTQLEVGEKDRAKITEPRWKASYDLAMGRLLALKVRAFGYNTMLAEMKASPRKFEKAGNNRWELIPAKEITSGASVKKLANRANEYLKRVVDEHAGTPWGLMAERELSRPLGWEWKEGYYNAAAMRGGNGNDEKLRPRFIEEEDPKTGKKVKKMVPAGPVRREI
ncbi:conserved hypothetical protein [Planctopirus limnophila DSM 3776]|uniref:VWFA domain-containing protein n=1 Tax=Planctopirus limnophila (strain ATCC 43296 / DSM 3776 / IFAM 1008 / Mu 290) TaxID=521674 RepID=D5SSG5_PLAL2|nr:vWA domain-containing protein [Planctopirus limnophila]ADG66713.1 conserved hypothetical protein [Planctopirus limnophila DSM 3776]